MNTAKVIALSKKLGPVWYNTLSEEFEKPYFLALEDKLKEVVTSGDTILPAKEYIFNAFKHTSPPKIHVVIIGQDPYPHHHAHGLCFSTLAEETPASLRNIQKELASDLRADAINNLTSWADQGVFMLNSVLTVSEGKANSHAGFGWEQFTEAALNKLYVLDVPKVWILWGTAAQNLYTRVADNHSKIHPGYIPPHKSLILKEVHPSPLSAYKGFFGSKPFSQTNSFLEQNGLEPIIWDLPF